MYCIKSFKNIISNSYPNYHLDKLKENNYALYKKSSRALILISYTNCYWDEKKENNYVLHKKSSRALILISYSNSTIEIKRKRTIMYYTKSFKSKSERKWWWVRQKPVSISVQLARGVKIHEGISQLINQAHKSCRKT